MPLPRRFFAPAFRHRRLGACFAALVGIMVYLATFSMAAEAALSVATLTWDRGMKSRLTVELPAVGDEASIAQPERVKQALNLLRAMPGVANAAALSDEETARLLKPWIHDADLLHALPVPALIDVERKPDAVLTAQDVAHQLRASLPDVQVDDHADWLTDLTRLVQGLAILGGLMIVLTALTLVIAVSLLCRAIMATERETIALLHVMGAEDNDIARHFEFYARRLSAGPSLTGFVLAMMSAGLLLFFLRHLADPALIAPMHAVILAGAVLLVPLLAIWIAAYSARLSVLNFLYSMP